VRVVLLLHCECVCVWIYVYMYVYACIYLSVMYISFYLFIYSTYELHEAGVLVVLLADVEVLLDALRNAQP